MPRHYIGADLSKDWIDIYHPKQDAHQRIKNKPAVIRAFLRNMEDDEIIIFEATSGCDDKLLSEIRLRGSAFVQANPAHAWFFARACNLPKTDGFMPKCYLLLEQLGPLNRKALTLLHETASRPLFGADGNTRI